MKKLLRNFLRWALYSEDNCVAEQPVALGYPSHGNIQSIHVTMAMNGYILSYFDRNTDRHITFVTEGDIGAVHGKLVTIIAAANLHV